MQMFFHMHKKYASEIFIVMFKNRMSLFRVYTVFNLPEGAIIPTENTH